MHDQLKYRSRGAMNIERGSQGCAKNFLALGLRRFLPPILPLALVGALLELSARENWVAPYLIPAPTRVLQTLVEDRTELLGALLSTATACSVGLLASFGIGSSIAIILVLSRSLRRAIYPYAIFFQTVPIIAIAPLLVIWFGFGKPTVMAAAFIVSVFPVIASTILGLESTDPALEDLFRLYQASRWQRLFKLKIPFALPQIFSGLKIASGLSVVGAIVGEFIAGGGLGEVIDVARTQQRIDKVFAAVFLSSLLGLTIVAVVNLLNWIFLRKWHVSEFSSESSARL